MVTDYSVYSVNHVPVDIVVTKGIHLVESKGIVTNLIVSLIVNQNIIVTTRVVGDYYDDYL